MISLMDFAERKLCVACVLLDVASVKTAGKQQSCLPFRHQPMSFCLEASSLHRYVLASCMALPAWFEIVLNTMSISDVAGTKG